MNHIKKVLLLLVFISTAFTGVTAQYTYELEDYLPDDVTYNPEIPKPSEILRYEVGHQHPDHPLIVEYMYRLAEASDRIMIQEYGETFEYRPLLLLTVSSPANIENIDRIRENHLRLSNPEESAGVNISEMPVVTWLGYSVHGSEPRGASASMLSAYYLAAAEGEKIDWLLDESIILIDPLLNPDGYTRFTSWLTANRSELLDGDPLNREHRPPWPGGRTNHYWFDLNRDWMSVVQPESRGRIKMYHQWKPNVLTDHHEFGTESTYFFMPGIPSAENPMIPERAIELTGKLAEYHSAFLDEINQLYFTEEVFDTYYPGRGSAYPDLQGGIGLLFEQANPRGHLHDSFHGKMSISKAIHNQFITSLSTLEGAHELREEFLAYMREFYNHAVDEARNSDTRAYVFGDGKDPARSWHMLDILNHHNIGVYSLTREIEHDGVSYQPGSAYIVPTEQPQYLFLESFFMEHHEFADTTIGDISTWTLPHAFNMDHARLEAGRRVTYSEDLLGERLETSELPRGTLYGEQDPYAYLFQWHGYYAPRAAYRLLDAGIRLKSASRTFSADTPNGRVDFDYGTIMLNMGIQDHMSPGEIHKIIETIAEEDGIDVYTVSTGLTSRGIDLGSRNFLPVQKPSTMILVGSGVDANEAGEVWHLLDQRYKMHHTLVDKNQLGRVDLNRYNNIVMVNGNYNDLSNSFIESLKDWIRDGGTLTTSKSATRWAVANDLADITFKGIPSRRTQPGDFPAYIDDINERRAQNIGGSIFESRIDLTHPLLYGYTREKLPVFRNSRIIMENTANPYASPVRYTSQPRISGYLSQENEQLLADIPGVAVASFGSGRVILMPDNPNFRGFWFGTNKLFANSLFFGNTIQGGATE